MLRRNVQARRTLAAIRKRVPLVVLATAIATAALTLFQAEALPPIIDLNNTSADLTVLGVDFADRAGVSVAAGDIDGDTTDDLIFGAQLADGSGTSTSCGTEQVGDRCFTGEVYVIYGAHSLPVTLNLNTASAGLTVFGDDEGSHLGYAVTTGDINGDTTDDLIIGAYLDDSTLCCAFGATYVIYGGADLPTTLDLNGTSAGLTVFGQSSYDYSGFSVAAGDINGDTTDDLIIGAWKAERVGTMGQAGEVYVVYGGPGLPATLDLNQCPADPTQCADFTVFGDDPVDRSGLSVTTGDINGDTTDDLIIGAYLADGSGAGTSCGHATGDRCEAGETYVVYGGASLPSTLDLNSTNADLTVFGDNAGDRSGISVAVGDINGDTTDDLIIGAYQANPVGGTQAGKTHVIYGGPGLPSILDLNNTNADLTVYGDDSFDQSGWSVAAGDIDGDTTDDLIIGAHQGDPVGGGDAGETYVIHGSPGLPATIDLDSTSADLTVFGDDGNDHSGVSVAAGDINGDTIDDLIIGADAAAALLSSTGSGKAHVIYGERPPGVGGIAELPEVAGTELEAEGSSGPNATVVAVLAGVAAGALALGGAAWWARRRWAR